MIAKSFLVAAILATSLNVKAGCVATLESNDIAEVTNQIIDILDSSVNATGLVGLFNRKFGYILKYVGIAFGTESTELIFLGGILELRLMKPLLHKNTGFTDHDRAFVKELIGIDKTFNSREEIKSNLNIIFSLPSMKGATCSLADKIVERLNAPLDAGELTDLDSMSIEELEREKAKIEGR